MTKTFRMVDGDLHFDINGRLEEIEGIQKLSQDVAEVLLTQLETGRDFGSELHVVEADPAFNISEQQVASFVSDAVDRLQQLQRTNPNTTRAEEIAAIETIEVFKNDQTEILFGLALRTTEGSTVASEIAVRQRPVSLRHLMPPSISEQDQDTRAELANLNPTITGEVSNNGS
jgi:hypothetical protein